MRLDSARVLLTNDDGITAKGLEVLRKAIEPYVAEVWVVAPENEQSGTGHSLTLRRPLRIRKISNNRFAVDGTPTDCVLLAISEIMSERLPHVILSGVNRGGNLGGDITYSGTVAAAMEGTLLGIKSIALSQVYRNHEDIEWDTAENWSGPVVKMLFSLDFPEGVLMNVNFPPIKSASVVGIAAVSQGQRKIGDELQAGLDPRGDKYFWIGSQRTDGYIMKSTDMAAIQNDMISVTPLGLDFTHMPTLKKLRLLSENVGKNI